MTFIGPLVLCSGVVHVEGGDTRQLRVTSLDSSSSTVGTANDISVKLPYNVLEHTKTRVSSQGRGQTRERERDLRLHPREGRSGT